MTRQFGGAGYWWMAARSRNASRRFAVMGIVGGLVFIAALIAFVLVPRQATQAAVQVTATLEERPDSMRLVLARNAAAAGVAAAESSLAIARRVVAPPLAAPVDTFSPAAIAQRQALSGSSLHSTASSIGPTTRLFRLRTALWGLHQQLLTSPAFKVFLIPFRTSRRSVTHSGLLAVWILCTSH